MTECPSCGAPLTGKVCACGYAVRPVVPLRKFMSQPSAVLRQKMSEKQREVNALVAKYQREHPGATKREACLAIMKPRERAMLSQAMDREALEERRAIQDES